MLDIYDKENVAPLMGGESSSRPSAGKKGAKGRSKSIGPGGIDEASHDRSGAREDTKNRRKSAYLPAARSIISKDTEKAERQAARRKTLANRRVSFAPEATLHTWDIVIDLARDQTTSTDSSDGTQCVPDHSTSQQRPDFASDPPSTPPGQEDISASLAVSPARQRDAHQKKRRRISGIPPMNFNNPEDAYSSVFSGDSDESGSGDDQEGPDDATGTAMSLDIEDATIQSQGGSNSSTSSSARLDASLKLAAEAAGTRGIEYDEFGDASMELAEDEVTNAFKPWAGQIPETLDSASLDQENVNSFSPAFKAQSISGGVKGSPGATKSSISKRRRSSLKLAAEAAGTRGIEYDEFGDASMELAEDEVTNAFKPWAGQIPETLGSASLDQENVNSFSPAFKAQSISGGVKGSPGATKSSISKRRRSSLKLAAEAAGTRGIEYDEFGEASMELAEDEVTNAFKPWAGQIPETLGSASLDQENVNPFSPAFKAQLISGGVKGSPGATKSSISKRRRSSGMSSADGSAMDLTQQHQETAAGHVPDDTNAAKIQLREFLEFAGIRFMDLTATKRRVTAAITPSKARHSGQAVPHHETERLELETTRQRLQGVQGNLEERRKVLADLQRRSREQDELAEALQENADEFAAAISEAERVKDACRVVSMSEIAGLKDAISELEQSFGWSIVSACASPPTIAMAYRSDLQLFFHPGAFYDSSHCVISRPNAPISLTYRSGKPIDTTLRFFLQLLRASLQALPQCSTRAQDMLCLVGNGWDTATATAEAGRRLKLVGLTDARIVSDERLIISTLILLPAVRTKVRVDYAITAAVANDESMKLGTKLNLDVKVVYGQQYDEKKMAEFLGKRLGDGLGQWALACQELKDKLIAGPSIVPQRYIGT